MRSSLSSPLHAVQSGAAACARMLRIPKSLCSFSYCTTSRSGRNAPLTCSRICFVRIQFDRKYSINTLNTRIPQSSFLRRSRFASLLFHLSDVSTKKRSQEYHNINFRKPIFPRVFQASALPSFIVQAALPGNKEEAEVARASEPAKQTPENKPPSSWSKFFLLLLVTLGLLVKLMFDYLPSTFSFLPVCITFLMGSR